MNKDDDKDRLRNASIEWQESGAPWSSEYEDVYFSRAGGMQETHYVFLAANNLENRWRQRDAEADTLADNTAFTIAELGFGTGLNFLCCWQLWRRTACRNLRLHYISCEKHPLTREALQQALEHWPELGELSEVLINSYPEHSGGYHRLNLQLPGDRNPVILDLYYGDAETQLRAQSNPAARIDAWFLDGFTPANNPALWSDSMLETIAASSHSGSTLSSYSVTGRVVRKLKALGFSVERRKGFGHKRHMLFAALETPAETSPDAAVPDSSLARKSKQTSKTVTVIGAGLAGCTVAWSLARRGFRVTVLEEKSAAASGASGNPQAILQCRLNRIPDALWQFNLLGFLYASRFYTWLQSQQDMDIEWHHCGVLTLETAYQNTRKPITPDSYSHYPPQLLRFVNAQEASALCGLTVQEAGLFLPDGGWLNPAMLCRRLLSHPGIELRTNTPVHHLEKKEDTWILEGVDGDCLNRSTHVVIANSYAARQFTATADYPVQALRGQISYLPASEIGGRLKSVVCGRSYLAPDNGMQHCIGASYVKDSEDTQLSMAEHHKVIEAVLPCVEELADQQSEATPGRAAVRGRSGDFVPLAGPVPDPDAWRSAYGGAQRISGNSVPLRKDLLPGLYMSIGHGSHGMASCPLLAEHIAALISGEASPLTEESAALVHPWRFIERRWRKAGKN